MAITDTVMQSIDRITVETAYGPPIVLENPFAPGPPNPLLQFLKPKITVSSSLAKNPIVAMPYGDPGPGRWNVVRVGLLIATALAVAGVVYIAKR